MRILSLMAILTLAAAQAMAGRQEPLPADLEGVGITEHLDGQLPLDAPFLDSEGKNVRLGDYFDGENPVILNLGYYSCPMLCGLVLNSLLDGMKGLKWTPGENFRVVTLSIDPSESTALARLKKKTVIEDFGRPEAADGWCFLTGMEENIRRVTDAAGFNFRWNDDRKEFAHAAGIMICTPDGRMSRYLYGVEYSPRDLRLALVEAADGKIGTTVDKILMYCFHYDSSKGRYAPAARRIMSAGGALAVLVLGGALFIFWRQEAKRKAAA